MNKTEIRQENVFVTVSFFQHFQVFRLKKQEKIRPDFFVYYFESKDKLAKLMKLSSE